jgi:hypothetical protein
VSLYIPSPILKRLHRYATTRCSLIAFEWTSNLADYATTRCSLIAFAWTSNLADYATTRCSLIAFEWTPNLAVKYIVFCHNIVFRHFTEYHIRMNITYVTTRCSLIVNIRADTLCHHTVFIDSFRWTPNLAVKCNVFCHTIVFRK